MTRSASTAVDWTKVESWTSAIHDGDLSAFREVFRMHGAEGPRVLWDPSVDQIEQAPLRFLLAYWSNLKNSGPIPLFSRIDPVDMRPALGHVMLLDVIDGGHDFRYRVFGTKIAAVSELDMTGRRLSEHRASPYIVEFALAVYRAALTRRKAVLTEHWPAGTRDTASWQRIVLPLTDATGQVVRFLAGTVPLNRTGEIVRARF